jgi:hypothetical protein
VCISRHPYDIAGMSTDRNWKSCMNLGGGKTWSEIGCRTRQIPIELQKGILVAYLIKDNDKNIKDPISRISIKPYIHEKDPDSMIFGMSNKIFGKKNLKFQTVVRNWVNSVNKKFFNKSGTYILAEGLYRDSKQGEDDIRTMD